MRCKIGDKLTLSQRRIASPSIDAARVKKPLIENCERLREKANSCLVHSLASKAQASHESKKRKQHPFFLGQKIERKEERNSKGPFF